MMKEFTRTSIWTTSWNRTWTTRVRQSRKRSQKVLHRVLAYLAVFYCQSLDLPPQTPMKKKKHDEDEPAKDEVRNAR